MKKTMLSTKQSYLVCFIGILAAFGIVMALCESGLADSYIKGIMMTACIAIIMTTSLNLTIGVLGQLTLGCCGFEAIGAYVAALTSKYMVAAGIAIDPTARFLLTTLIGGVVACVFGILIGIPALRLHGDYLAIITLGFGEIIRVIIQNLKVAGGMGLDKGAAGQALIGIERTANLYVVFWIMVVTVVVLFMFGRSRYGRAVKAIRDDEIAAEAMGINLAHHKRMAFTISSFFAGISGALLAMYQTTVQANTFKSAMTYEILLIVAHIIIRILIHDKIHSHFIGAIIIHGHLNRETVKGMGFHLFHMNHRFRLNALSIINNLCVSILENIRQLHVLELAVFVLERVQKPPK